MSGPGMMTCSQVRFFSPPQQRRYRLRPRRTLTPPLSPAAPRHADPLQEEVWPPSDTSLFPYREKEKKDWLLASATNNVRYFLV